LIDYDQFIALSEDHFSQSLKNNDKTRRIIGSAANIFSGKAYA
jgi:hypothetical protein